MKLRLLSALLIFSITGLSCGEAKDGLKAAPPAKESPTSVKPIRSYLEVLSVVPANLRTTKAAEWTAEQRNTANAVLKETFIDRSTPAKLRVTVTSIGNWGGMTLHSNIPNKEGYPIRVFGKFTEEGERKLAALKRGDTVVLDGELKSVSYENVWGKFTLSICLRNCVPTKVENAGDSIVNL